MSALNNSNNSNQQTLAESGANARPPMLEKGNDIPWESRFRRFLDNQLEEGERMWHSIQHGPYQRPLVPNHDNPEDQILEPLSKMTEGDKKKYIADERIKRLMHGSDITATVRHSQLIDEFDKFTAKEGESLDSVYERLTILVNIMDRNNVRPILVAINIKFLNCLQPEWSKYVTMVRQNQYDKVISYDMLYDSLVQFKSHVLASRAKKAAKNHDHLALFAHSNASSSHPHANSSYSPQSYYVTHPPSIIDYDDEYQRELQGDSQEDKLITAMMNQMFNAGNASDESNQIVQRVPRTDSTLSKMNVQCYNCNEKVMKDEAGSHLSNEENGFMLDNAYADGTTDTVPSYDDKAESQVHALSKAHEQISHEKRKTIIQTMDDDQIDSSIIFNDLYVDNNGGMSKHDSIAHEENHKIQMLAYNVQREAEKQKHVNNELKKQKVSLQQELETFKDWVETFDAQIVQCSKYKETCDDLKSGLGYQNPERLKKAIAAQPKMYDGDMLHSEKLIINSTDSEETLEDAEESRNKMKNKMIHVNYDKINVLYETFVPQQEISAEQTCFSIPSTSNHSSESKDVPSE
ncbi:hypothetical protein Tco_0066756 [Tanacetum coccineum]